MEVKIINEAGYTEALFGMSLSFYDGLVPLSTWWAKQARKASTIAPKLAHKDGGHNKFLEHIEVWIMVNAPLSWWKQADTYRMSTKLSTSTMHTLKKRFPLGSEDFSKSTNILIIDTYNSICSEEKDINIIADNLPSGFLQDRLWKVSYKTLRNIVHQRKNHRLKDWDDFIEQVLEQIEHPELINKEEL